MLRLFNNGRVYVVISVLCLYAISAAVTLPYLVLSFIITIIYIITIIRDVILCWDGLIIAVCMMQLLSIVLTHLKYSVPSILIDIIYIIVIYWLRYTEVT